MIVDIKKIAHKFIYYIKSQIYKKTDNQFLAGLFQVCKNYGKRYDVFVSIKEKYEDKLNSINENLYLKLSESDKDTLLRFFVKAFFNVNTATKEEIEIIDQAFNRTRELYKNKGNKEFVEFLFRDKNIKYFVNCEVLKDDSIAENILMNYYDLTHAFFLTEYEMKGFNPKDGETIFDCGAAYGDTMLLFRALYPNSRIYSFECSNENVERINRNIKLNNIENVVINNAFLYFDSNLHYFDKDNKVVDNICSDESNKAIKTLSIDDYVRQNNISNIGLIKFDIEGGEQEALKGTIETIKSQKPLLYIPIYHLDSDIYAIPEFLQQLDMPMEFRIKWTEKKVWGVDCVLFVKFV